jgi:transcriptional regulator of acetoin/glycerol metabolism
VKRTAPESLRSTRTRPNDALVAALQKTPSIAEAAKLLGIPRSTLQWEMAKRGILIRRIVVIEGSQSKLRIIS